MYQTDVYPLLESYNKTDQNAYPLTTIDNLNYIRGAGLWNPAPIYPQTTDRGHAWDNIKDTELNTNLEPIAGNVYINPAGAAAIEGTWEKNIISDMKVSDGSDYKNFDEFQRFALNCTRKIEPEIMPYFFSSINVHFIQNKVVEYIKKEKNITIKTKQDTDDLLAVMLNTYTAFLNSEGILNATFNDTDENQAGSFSRILGLLNKKVIQIYVQSTLSTLNMTEYYFNDISQLPIPLTNPVYSNNKGSKVLGFVGYFEDNHKVTKNIDSFNMRDVIPEKINTVNFGN